MSGNYNASPQTTLGDKSQDDAASDGSLETAISLIITDVSSISSCAGINATCLPTVFTDKASADHHIFYIIPYITKLYITIL